MNFPRIRSIATAVPKYEMKQSAVMEAVETIFSKRVPKFRRFLPVYENAKVDCRYSAMPIEWFLEPRGMQEKNQIYIESALDMLEQVTVDASKLAGIKLDEIDEIVTVSSTGIATPSLDALLMERLKLKRTIKRTPLFGLGCAGGVTGLGRAASFAKLEPKSNVLLLVVELCTLTFQFSDASANNVVGTALFGDGAAGAIISCQGDGPKIKDQSEFTWEDSLRVMGWNVMNDGLNVIFSSKIPEIVQEKMKPVLDNYLASQKLSLNNFDYFVPHPGGIKVLNALEDLFGIERDSLVHSRNTLKNYGNMSSATVWFSLKEALKDYQADKRFLLTSLGPGFSANMAILES